MKEDIKNLIKEVEDRKLIDKLYLDNLIDLDTYFKYSGYTEKTQDLSSYNKEWIDNYFVKPKKNK